MRSLTAFVVAFSLSACTTMPATEGPTARLFPGIERPRDRKNMDITIHESPGSAWGRCLESSPAWNGSRLSGASHGGR